MNPTGTGIYIRRIDRRIHGTPAQAAKKAADHGISFVAIMGAWQQPRADGKVRAGAPNKKKLKAYVEAFRARGILVGLWYYPWAGYEEQILTLMRQQSESVPIDFWLNDAELGYKWKRRLSARQLERQAGANMRSMQPEAIRDMAPEGSRTKVQAAAQVLMAGVQEAKREGLLASHGSTAYGISKFHPNFPWEVFLANADWVSPQLYTSTPKQVDLGIGQWYELAASAQGTSPDELRNRADFMIPSIATYGQRSGPKMHDYLSTFVDANEGVDGFCAWSWRQTSAAEWRTLARWSDWLARGACILPEAG